MRQTSNRLNIGMVNSFTFAALIITLALTPSILIAQEEDSKSWGDAETVVTPTMREALYKSLAKAQESAEEKDYPQAIKQLDKIRNGELNSYELSQVLNLYAYIYYAQDNYPKAIDSYEELLKQPDLPVALKTGTMHTLSQLYFSTEQWQKSIDKMNQWLASGQKPKPQTYELLAQAYYQKKEYKEK